jgi:hypothetical protein
MEDAERRTKRRRLTEVAQAMHAAGADVDQIARELLRRTPAESPIMAIASLSAATGLFLGDAKETVYRNLEPAVRTAAENLWAEILDELDQAMVSDLRAE